MLRNTFGYAMRTRQCLIIHGWNRILFTKWFWCLVSWPFSEKLVAQRYFSSRLYNYQINSTDKWPDKSISFTLVARDLQYLLRFVVCLEFKAEAVIVKKFSDKNKFAYIACYEFIKSQSSYHMYVKYSHSQSFKATQQLLNKIQEQSQQNKNKRH